MRMKVRKTSKILSALCLSALVAIPSFADEWDGTVTVTGAAREGVGRPLTVDVAITGGVAGEWLYVMCNGEGCDGDFTNGWAIVRKFVLTEETKSGGTFELPGVKSCGGVVKAIVRRGDAPGLRTPLKYVEVSDDVLKDNQFFDTERPLQLGDVYEAKMRTAEILTSHWFLMGASTGGTEKRATVFYSYDGKWYFAYNSQKSTTGISVSANTFYRLRSTFENGNQTCEIAAGEDDYQVIKSFNVSEEPTCTHSLGIFRRNRDGSFVNSECYPAPVGTRLYWLTVRNGGDLVNNYVPCLHHENGRPCLYDRQTGNYLENKGTVDFNFEEADMAASEPRLWGDPAPEGASTVTITRAAISDDGPALVRLAFDNLAGGERLFIVHDAYDRGSLIENWSFSREVDTLEFGVTNGIYQIDGLPASSGVTRAMLLKGVSARKAPWGTVIPYLESKNSAYLDTEYVHQYGNAYESRMRTSSTSSAKFSFIGAYGTNKDKTRSNVVHVYESYWDVGMNNQYGSVPKVRIQTSCDYFLRTSVDLEGKSTLTISNLSSGVLSTTGYSTKPNPEPLGNTDRSLYVFARQANTTVDENAPDGTQIRSLTIADAKGTLLHDYLPVRDAEDRLCLYDTIGKTYHYNISATSKSAFVCDDDAAFSEKDRLVAVSAPMDAVRAPYVKPASLYICDHADGGGNRVNLAFKTAFDPSAEQPYDVQEWLFTAVNFRTNRIFVVGSDTPDGTGEQTVSEPADLRDGLILPSGADRVWLTLGVPEDIFGEGNATWYWWVKIADTPATEEP